MFVVSVGFCLLFCISFDLAFGIAFGLAFGLALGLALAFPLAWPLALPLALFFFFGVGAPGFFIGLYFFSAAYAPLAKPCLRLGLWACFWPCFFFFGVGAPGYFLLGYICFRLLMPLKRSMAFYLLVLPLRPLSGPCPPLALPFGSAFSFSGWGPLGFLLFFKYSFMNFSGFGLVFALAWPWPGPGLALA